jgi:3-oxoacyl-[acyl-carrier protein] reductase
MKVVIITGTSKGIGKYLANEYLQLDEYFVIGCSRSASELIHDRYSHFQLDVSDEKAVMKMCREVYKKFKQIDVLINNAGIASMNHSLMTPGNTVKRLIETNYMGTFLFCREVAKLMTNKKSGKIVNFSTVAVPLNLEGELAYASSKAAVESLTRIFAKELANYGITCNCVGPTPIDTDLIKNVGADKIDKLIQLQAIKKKANFEDIKNVIDFFISEKSEMITGQVVYLGGIF